ncbi:hypothetical protein B566_EDAN004188, partial [Ephemera danica]
MRRPDSFVLDPVSAQAKLKRNRSEQQLRSRSQPRIICDLSLEAMNLTLTDVQYGQIVGLARGLEQLSQQREAQLSQSSCPSHMELSATWRWAAYRALTLSRVSALYRDLYVQYLQSPNSLPADLKSLKDVIEVRYSYEALREVREAAMQVAAQHTRDSATASSGAGRGLLLQWFPLWSGWYASTPAQQLRSPNEEEEGLEQELLQALKESQVQEDSPLTRDAVLAVTSMTLQRGSLRLIASDRPANHPVAEEDETDQRAKSSGHAVLELELEQLTMKAELRPRFNSRCFSFIRPLGMKVDYRLHVESRSLAIVYNPSVVQAVADFFAHGHTTSHNPAWRKRYENMKRKTKERILQNWEQMLEGDQRERTKWDLKLNVSAPQILFAESFCDKSATVVLIDFGKLNVRNIHDGINIVVSPPRQPSEEDDECFHTPCSSPQTECKSPSVVTPKHDLSESALHQKMYDRFSIELGDMQILVGRTRDNLKHAHHKGTSTLHVLDRFNISIMLESRALYSNDPNLPSLKFSGSLPKLVVHINEQKVAAIRSMIHHMQGEGLPSPFRTQDFSPVHQADVEATQEARTVNESANLLVKGVRAGLIQRPYETSASLSVHSLLLVDAMQTYGNDFDLLVASHQRVGMDSISGSLRDSEPTSPTSPISSPDPSRGRSTSPLALSQALRSLQARAASPPPLDILEPPDMEALIYVEILSLGQGCPSLEPGETSRHVATVNCNCLDLIANQETVVELVGFVHRLFPESKSVGGKFMAGSSIDNLTAEPMAKIELIFEFQRLNVLLLRAIIKDNKTQARKIATATLTEAKIQATVGNDLVIKGSLGGVQSSEVQRADVLYSCATDATPILHDTLLKLSLELERGRCVMRPTSESLPSLLMDQSLDFLDVDSQDVVQVRGCVVRSLQVSLSRFQYEQLLDCVDLLTSGIENVPPTPDPNVGFSLDPSLRTRLLGAQPLPATTPVDHRPTKHKFVLGVLFELPELRVTLRDNLRNSEQDKVLVSFGDFVVKYDKSDPYETSIKMSLRSLVVEDLSQPEDSAHRKLVVSQFLSEEELLDVRNVPLYASRSCPDVSTNLGSFKKRGSLPDVLETSVLYGMGYKPNQTQPTQMFQPSGEYPVTPPPSPRRTGSPKDQMARKDNLVHIDVLLIDPKSPDFFSKYNTNQRYVDVNFNCLDVIVNIESWVLILDFFGITEQQQPVKEATPRKPKIITSTPSTSIKLEETTNLEIDFKVRSLTLVLARVSGGELARANVAQLTARIEKRGSESVISGKLGKLSLTDLTSHGRLYRERFTTTGGLDFNIKNYSKPDPSMTREFDT